MKIQTSKKLSFVALPLLILISSFQFSNAAAAASKIKEPKDLTSSLTAECAKHYPGVIQAEVRDACSAAAGDFLRIGKGLAQTKCRLNFGDEPRLVMACLIGTTVADQMQSGADSFKQKLQLCADTYPVHNEIDAFLQESCMAGVYIPTLMSVTNASRSQACSEITPERSFIGPCAVGLTLAQEAGNNEKPNEMKVPAAKQNLACEQYFNHKQFHIGYRACLNGRSLGMEADAKYSDVIKGCSDVTGEGNNDTERAACLVGATIFRQLAKKEDMTDVFKKCGETKVTYEDRNVLACLTAASLLNFTTKGGAEAGCKDIFKDMKAKTRRDCVTSLTLF